MTANPEIELAWQCIERTGSHLFLTGKAGTGKTTFLRELKKQSPKRMIVVAPTGIAAINAGGVTIHSFFQLSFAPHIPDTTLTSRETPYKFGKEKIKIIRSMDLLVIDEVSMVRADLLDAVDTVLRRYRDRSKPFGGVQLLLIGDLQQLAPVIKEDEWTLLSRYYDTPYFFGSRALRETSYITIQLEHVYRQSDIRFLSLLNRIRVNDVDENLLAELNKRYIPGFRPREEEGYIRLTTHNYQAQRINDRQLSFLPGTAITFKAEVKGNFPETAYPADADLTIKTGAQIMFIKNDSSAEKRFYNGKIGVVTAVSKDAIRVKGREDNHDFLLEKEEWTNSKYTLNEESREITEEVEGIFKQYPIRLAWAITIHKSQGLTFEHAVIDASLSFAHGQVYVALSRCKTLEGMVLGSPLTKEAVICDESVNEFSREVEHSAPDKAKLNNLMQRYFYDLVCELFDFSSINRQFTVILRILDEHLYRLYPKLLERYKENHQRFAEEIEKISSRFQMQYSAIIMETADYSTNPRLQERIKAGAGYFLDKTEEIIFSLVRDNTIETDNKDVKKRLTDAYSSLYELLEVKAGVLKHTKEEGFSVTAYLKRKAVILLSLQESPAKTTGTKRQRKKDQVEKVTVPSDILYPALYAQLVRWRSGEASRVKLPAYTILQQKGLMGIANLLPVSTDELIKIPYCGKKLVENHGLAILEIVRKFIQDNGIQKGNIF